TANRELKNMQLQLIRQEKLASIGQLAASLAHELNNPLSFLKSNHQLIQKYMEDIKPVFFHVLDTGDLPEGADKLQLKDKITEIEEMFHDSSEGFSHIISVIRNLLSFAHGGGSIQGKSYDLHKGIESTLKIIDIKLRNIADVQTDFGDVPLIECSGDEINQVLLNILTNAAQAISERIEKEPDFIGKVGIKTGRIGEGRIECAISNNGYPIPQDIRENIFDPFFSTKEPGKGTGLGLSIAWDIIVKRHNGTFRVESNGETVFRFTLPIEQNDTNKQ
ncbi:MAG: sensor histidine kinase, partial [Spirochaetia bacterium]